MKDLLSIFMIRMKALYHNTKVVVAPSMRTFFFLGDIFSKGQDLYRMIDSSTRAPEVTGSAV